jgi:hypothetical protein
MRSLRAGVIVSDIRFWKKIDDKVGTDKSQF